MMTKPPKSLKLDAQIETWPLKVPFRISGRTISEVSVVFATIESSAATGRGEAAGVFFLDETASTMVSQIETVADTIERGVDRAQLQKLLPAGGARNAIDCALWELEAKTAGRPIWEMANIDLPCPAITAFTIGVGTPGKMARKASLLSDARVLKLKLCGDASDADRVIAVRAERPGVRLFVDGNQGMTIEHLAALMPVLVRADVELVEQPLPIGLESALADIRRPIPIAADESACTAGDLHRLRPYFDVINIKLDKCGGLTGGLEMARLAREVGFDIMVGNMFGTSLAMAPAFLIAQMCDYVDLDGPTFLRSDRKLKVEYEEGKIWCPPNLWG